MAYGYRKRSYRSRTRVTRFKRYGRRMSSRIPRSSYKRYASKIVKTVKRQGRQRAFMLRRSAASKVKI